MSMVQINWNPTPSELRKFGVTVLLGFALLGLLFQFRLNNTVAGIALYAVAAVLGGPALSGTVLGKPGYVIWMGIAFVMGSVMSRILLSIIYFGVVTPIGILRRAQGADRLTLNRPKATSYWTDVEPVPEDPDSYERQF